MGMTYSIKSELPFVVDLGKRSGKFYALSSAKPYVLTIRDLPEKDKPREKLLASGPGALSPKELLAIVFEKGTRKEGVLAMTERIAREYGERNRLTRKSFRMILKFH